MKRGPSQARKPLATVLIEEIVTHKLLQQFVTVELADEAASIIVICNVGRVFRKNVADNLIDRVISFFGEGTIDLRQNLLHFVAAVSGDGELDSAMLFQSDYLLYPSFLYHIP